MKKKKQNDNLIYYVPYKNPNFTSIVNDEGYVIITIPQKGIINKIAQTLFFSPKETKIKLDKLGSFVWNEIDGEQDIENIANSINTNYKGKAEPLYERLIMYLKIMQKNGLILIRKADEKNKIYFNTID